MIRIIFIPSECCPVIDGIAFSSPVLMKILDNPKSGPVTFWNSNLVSCIVDICQVGDVIVRHAKDVSDFDDALLGKCSDQNMISWELKDSSGDIGQGQLGIGTRENHA
jgi:hypothetical protein